MLMPTMSRQWNKSVTFLLVEAVSMTASFLCSIAQIQDFLTAETLYHEEKHDWSIR